MRRTQVLDAPALETWRARWSELAHADPQATPFQTPEWVGLWHRRLAPRRPLRAIAVTEGDDLVALWPLALSQGFWRVWRSAGTGPSDYLPPLVRPGAEAACHEIADFLADRRDADLIDLHQLPARHPMAAALSGVGQTQATCLRVDLPSTFAEYVKGLSKSLRYDVKRLDKLDPARYRIVEEPDLEPFLRLHAERWRKRGLPGAFVGRLPAFHREWVALAQSKGWLRLSTLTEDGKPVGSLYGMAFGRTTYFYQSGFAPASKSLSPGTLLVAHTIRRAIEEGREVFDLMRGDEPYKRRWQPTQEEANLRFLMPGKGLLARPAEGWNRTAFRAEGRLRSRLEGKGLLA